jgi:hypothetical protein
MKNEMMDAVVYKMMLDLERMYEEMTNEQKTYAQRAIGQLLMLRGELVNAEETEDA